jgi:hypothetical protein
MLKNLNAEMVRFDVPKEKLAELLGIALPTLYSRMSGGGFSCAEATIIRDFFNDTFGTNFTIDYLFNSAPIVLIGVG